MDPIKLDKRQIVREALLLLREDGIEKLSMRKLAARLHIRAPTLYWYFPDRAAILRQVINELLEEAVGRVPACATWQDWLMKFGQSLWRTNCEAPYATLLLQSAELNDATVINVAVKTLREKAGEFGANEAIFLRAHSDLNAFVTGYAVFWHAGVTDKLAGLFDVERAVLEGIDMIVRHWANAASEASIKLT